MNVKLNGIIRGRSKNCPVILLTYTVLLRIIGFTQNPLYYIKKINIR